MWLLESNFYDQAWHSKGRAGSNYIFSGQLGRIDSVFLLRNKRQVGSDYSQHECACNLSWSCDEFYNVTCPSKTIFEKHSHTFSWKSMSTSTLLYCFTSIDSLEPGFLLNAYKSIVELTAASLLSEQVTSVSTCTPFFSLTKW